jgi:hypothetical protein
MSPTYPRVGGTLLTGGPMDDIEFLRQVKALLDKQIARGRTPELEALSAETWRRLTEAAELRERLVLRYTGPTLSEFVLGPAASPLPVRLRTAGAHAVALAVLNPGRQVSLGRGRSRRAWHAAILRAVEVIAGNDPKVAATEREGPGLRLWEGKDQVRIRWRATPGKPEIAAW